LLTLHVSGNAKPPGQFSGNMTNNLLSFILKGKGHSHTCHKGVHMQARVVYILLDPPGGVPIIPGCHLSLKEVSVLLKSWMGRDSWYAIKQMVSLEQQPS